MAVTGALRCALEGVVDAGITGTGANGAELLQGARTLCLPVQDVVLLKDDVAVESNVLSSGLKSRTFQ